MPECDRIAGRIGRIKQLLTRLSKYSKKACTSPEEVCYVELQKNTAIIYDNGNVIPVNKGILLITTTTNIWGYGFINHQAFQFIPTILTPNSEQFKLFIQNNEKGGKLLCTDSTFGFEISTKYPLNIGESIMAYFEADPISFYLSSYFHPSKQNIHFAAFNNDQLKNCFFTAAQMIISHYVKPVE
ncbi:hypothetical protein [Propionispora vibrioides]|uniref:hypothetical protein n=1 Tax=Propionispora vibrioides TaxID=112903 RepID=UPI000B808DA2|nr:hypothetical protein [Propionispora vibrioides]